MVQQFFKLHLIKSSTGLLIKMHWKTLVLTLTTLVVVVKTKYVELDLSEDNEVSSHTQF